jgi:hypothetical protein
MVIPALNINPSVRFETRRLPGIDIYCTKKHEEHNPVFLDLTSLQTSERNVNITVI